MPQSNWTNWSDTARTRADFNKKYGAIQSSDAGTYRDRDQVGIQTLVDALMPLSHAAGGIAPGAYGNLFDIINSQGKTSPTAMNRDIAGISRNAQTGQQDFEGMMQAMGLGGSGVGMAISQAIGQGGREQIAGRQAQETQMAEERKRSDLQLFLNMITNPALSAAGMTPQQPQGPSKSEQQLQYLSLIASLMSV